MTLLSILQKLYKEGSLQGQCFSFLHKLASFPSVGNTLGAKKKALKSFGISEPTEIQVGDIILTDESFIFGHGCFVNQITQAGYQVTESNFNLDLRVHHTRIIPFNSPHILGIFRKPLLFQTYTFPLSINVSLIMNTPKWPSLLDHIHNAQEWFRVASEGKLQINIIPSYSNIPPTWEVEANPVAHIKESWFNEFILPVRFPGSHIVIFNTDRKDFPGSVFGDPSFFELGFAYKYNTDLPLKIMTLCYEHDDYPPYYPSPLSAYAKYMAHEIMHLLYNIALNSTTPCNGRNYVLPVGTDLTHNWFLGENGYPIAPERTLKDLDYSKLALKVT